MEAREPHASLWRTCWVAAMASMLVCTGLNVAAAKTYTIAVAAKTQLQRRWTFDIAAMRKEASKLGARLIIQYANDDPNLQASQVENLLSQGPDALILIPVDTKAAGPLVDSARQQTIPVVDYDVGIATARPDFFVARDNVRLGILQATAAKRFAPAGVYALIKGDPGNDVAQIVGQVYQKLLANQPGIKIVYDQFTARYDPRAALAAAENVLSAQNDDVNAFVVTNDGMAMGVAQAVTSRNLGGKVFLSGLDAEPANLRLIATGVQTMTVWTDIVDEATSAVDAAMALAQNKRPEVSNVLVNLGAGPVPEHLVPVMAVDRNNLCRFINVLAPKGWVAIAQVFPNDPAACK